MSVGTEPRDTDDVSGASQAPEEAGEATEAAAEAEEGGDPDPDAALAPPPEVEELSAACVRFVAARYGITLDYRPDTLALLDQWVRDARVESELKPEIVELVQSSAGAYLGEVFRREWGAKWSTAGEYAEWRLFLSTVYLAFNPLGMAREALLLETADGWNAHFELDPAERDAIEARLDALPPAPEEEFYAPSTRYDVVSIVFDALREGMRSRGLADVRFTPEDYE